MDWVKLSARYYLDVAISNLPDADTEVMFTRALAYAGDQETGGFVPAGMLPALCRSRRYEVCARALVTSGLWLASRGGYQITRWEEWQSELEAIARRRSADRERKRHQRLREKDDATNHRVSRDTVSEGNNLETGVSSQVKGMSRDASADCHAESPPPREKRVRTTTSNDVVGHVRDDVERVCEHLAARIEANGSKRPSITKRWQDAARLMLDTDGRSEAQVIRCIDWSQDHEFWRTVILSMPKLRQKYDQLRLQAARPGTNGKQAETDAQFARAMARATAREENHDPERNGAANPVRQSLLPAAGDG